MKKSILALMGACIALSASAEGYQVNTLSAKQGGMAHTGVAQKLGAESIYFNPAGLGFMNSALDISGSFNAVLATANATTSTGKYTTDNDPSTPFMVNAAFSIYDNFKAGVGLYVPYGSGINWGQSWPGATLSQKVDLKAFTVQPTFSWKITPNLSIGGGLMVSWGNVNLDKGLINPGTMDTMIGLLKLAQQVPAETPMFNGTTPASVNLQGTSNVALGYNLGIMWQPAEQWIVGAEFRSKSTVKVQGGEASVNYANSIAQGLLESELGMIDKANFTAEMPLPWVLTFGASYKPTSKLLLALDCQLTGWSAYKTLDITFDDPNISKYDQHLEKNYKNSWAFRLGACYSLTDRFDLRAGCILDLSPVNKEYYNPETPGMTKIEPSVGLSFRPLPNLSIDFSMLYVGGLGIDNASCTYADMLAPRINSLLPASQHLPLTQTFTADYKVHAWVPSIGVSFTL